MAGSSDWFERGFVTYSNQAKVDELDVSPDALNHFGAVSEPVALEMATGVLLAAQAAHVAVSTTGIAGPGGATPGKPVGMVCFGFAMRNGDGISSRAVTHVFPGDRAQVRQAAVEYALRDCWNSSGRRSTGVEGRAGRDASGLDNGLPWAARFAVATRPRCRQPVRVGGRRPWGASCQRTALIASRRPLAAAPAASRQSSPPLA